jgi:hypothetical protein
MVFLTQDGGNYGVILSQDSMQLLNLDTSVNENKVFWGEKEIAIVPGYWIE